MNGLEKNAYDGSDAMNGKSAAVLLSGLLIACVQTQPPEATTPPAPSPPPVQTQATPPAQAAAEPPPDRIVSIRRARCEDLLGLAPDDRAAASMFYIGYQASRLRASTINVGVISSIEEQAIGYCEEHPDRTVVQAFANAYSRARKQ
jgi:hypothetical protein